MSETGWDKHAVRLRKTHEAYILFILLSILVGVLTVKWSDVPKLTDYLSFALTLASLLLAVMAIGYAIYSNQGLEANLASLVSSITDVKEIASSLSNSSLALSTDLRSLSQTTGGIDKRITEIAESARAQDQKKQAVVQTDAAAPVSTSFDLEQFALRTSNNGRQVLFAMAIAFLNKREMNLRAYFERTGMSIDYNYGFFIAVSSAEIFIGSADFNKIKVDEFRGVDEKFLGFLLDDILSNSETPGKPRIRELTLKDFGRMRTYLEEEGFRHFGSLEPYVKEPLLEPNETPAA